MKRVTVVLFAVLATWVSAQQSNRADPCVVLKNVPYTDMCGTYQEGGSDFASLYQNYDVWNRQPFRSGDSQSFGYYSDKIDRTTVQPMRRATCDEDRFLPQSTKDVQQIARSNDYDAPAFASDWTKDDAAKFLGFNYGRFGAGNNPPFCLQVSGTLNRKVQVIVETDSEDSRVCVRNNNQQTSQDDPSAVEQCGSGQFKACFLADYDADCSEQNQGACNKVPDTKKSMNLYFYCDGTNCAEQDETAFYFKIQVSNSPYNYGEYNAMNDGLEMWCSIVNDGAQCESTGSGSEEDAYCNSESHVRQTRLLSMYPSELLSEAEPNPQFEMERGVFATTGAGSSSKPSALLLAVLCSIAALFIAAVAPQHC